MTSSVDAAGLTSVGSQSCYTPADDSSSGSDTLDGEVVINTQQCTARLAQLLDSAKFSDVTLVVGSRRFRCHRLLLASASSVLESVVPHLGAVSGLPHLNSTPIPNPNRISNLSRNPDPKANPIFNPNHKPRSLF